ncbi:MAG TPA: hypothetical protein VLH35_04770 [Candidatus Acidoferrales bacterium]|nr:hypothetical protein [Candidatus Acidoferrales bacterium]
MSRRRRDENMDVAASSRSAASRGKMTVEEAGRRGGAKGGPRVRELIEEGREHEEE